MNHITPDTIVRKNDDIFAGNIDDEMVAINIQNGKYYQLNKTGARILSALDQPCSVRELCLAMQVQYRVDDEICRKDVLAFLTEMAEYQLVMAE